MYFFIINLKVHKNLEIDIIFKCLQKINCYYNKKDILSSKNTNNHIIFLGYYLFLLIYERDTEMPREKWKRAVIIANMAAIAAPSLPKK